jgi:uncharacterized protein
MNVHDTYEPDVVSAISRASLAVGRLDGSLAAAPEVIVGRLRDLTEESGDQAGAANRNALAIALDASDGRNGLVDRLLNAGDSSAIIALCRSVADLAERAVAGVRTAVALWQENMRLADDEQLGRYGRPMIDLLAEQPVLTVGDAVGRLGATPTTVGWLLDRLVQMGVVEETTGRRRNRLFRYSPFLDVFDEIIALSGAAGRHTMAMASDMLSIADWVPIAVERILAGSEAERVIVFGSVARREAGPDSDIDLLVVLPHVTNAHDDAVRLMRLLHDLPVAVDVIVTDADRLQLQSKVPGVVRVALREGRQYERAV